VIEPAIFAVRHVALEQLIVCQIDRLGVAYRKGAENDRDKRVGMQGEMI
jgi:hypothetical protein